MTDIATAVGSLRRAGKSPEAFRTISEVATDLDVPQHVLRFWETKFSQIKPLKRGGGRRYYRPEDVELLRHIRALLYAEGYTIKGVQKVLREVGPRGLVDAGRTVEAAAPEPAAPPRLAIVAPADSRQLTGLGETQRLALKAALNELRMVQAELEAIAKPLA